MDTTRVIKSCVAYRHSPTVRASGGSFFPNVVSFDRLLFKNILVWASKTTALDSKSCTLHARTFDSTFVIDRAMTTHKQYPECPKQALSLAKYWVCDVGKSARWILEQAKEGMCFDATNAGWHVHTSSDLAIPGHFEAPPSQVFGRSLVHVALLCFLCEKRAFASLAMMTPSHPIEHAICQICNEMLCPSATFASCLRNVMHPGITQFVTDFAYKTAEQFGYNETERVFVRYMQQPLKVYTHAHYEEVMAAVEQMGIQFMQTPTKGHVYLSCNVFLSCHPTDHVLLFVQLVHNEASVVCSMLDDLRKTSGGGHKALFGVMSEFISSQ